MSFTPTTTRGKNAPTRYVAWSFSKLRNFFNCPRKHLEVDIEKKWSEGESSDAIDFGNAVHAAMEHRIKNGTPIPPHLQSYMASDMEAWCNKVLHGFHDAVDYERATRGRMGIELQLAITEDFQTCGWFDKQKNVWSRAKIDVAKTSGHVGLLLDWKTGRVSDRENEQLLISACVAFIHFPELQAIRTCYVWLKEDATTTLDVTRADVPKIWADLLPKINEYRRAVAANEFPEKPGPLCRFCPVRACEHNPGR